MKAGLEACEFRMAKRRQWTIDWGAGAASLGLAVGAASMLEGQRTAKLAAITTGFVAIELVRLALRRRYGARDSTDGLSSDPEPYALAKECAAAVGRPAVRAIWMSEERTGRIAVHYAAGVLSISRSAWTDLTPDELRFLILCELSVARWSRGLSASWPAITAGIVVLAAFSADTTRTMLGAGAIAFVASNVVGNVLAKLGGSRRARFRRALKITCDPGAAKSAIRKAETLEAGRRDAVIRRAIKDIDAASRSLGLSLRGESV